MAYGHEYINEFKQFGVISYTLRLIDDEGIMPNVTVPVVIEESNLNEEHMLNVASSLKNLHTKHYLDSIIPVVIEPEVTLTDSLSTELESTLTDNLSTELESLSETPIETPIETPTEIV